MKLKTLSAIILCATSMQVLADEQYEKQYWVGTGGDYVRDRNGHCIRTILWTPENAIPSCEGEMDTSAEATADAGSNSNAQAGEATAVAAVAAIDEEPDYTTLSLSSSATFELGGSTLSPEGKAAVADIVAQFKGREVKSVIIEGYTDNSGDAAFNQDLSEKRAEAVKAEAVANGANPDKITTVGYGEANPIADNSTREGRARNRRVEIKIDEK